MPRESPSRQSRRTLLGYFYELEEALEIEHVEGRGWHGLRCIASDLSGDITDDERVREVLGGWESRSGTRARIYESDERPAVLRKAARVRRVLRGAAGEEEIEDENPLREVLRAQGVPAEKMEAAEEMLAALAGTG